jgi:hypothetical protein
VGLSEDAVDLAVGEEADLLGGGDLGQSGHAHDVAGQGDNEAGSGGEAQLADREGVAGGRALGVGVGAEAVLGLGDADREVAVAGGFEGLGALDDGGLRRDAGGAVDARGDGLDLLQERQVERVEWCKVCLTRLDGGGLRLLVTRGGMAAIALASLAAPEKRLVA